MKKTGFLFLLLLNFSLALFARDFQSDPNLVVHYWAKRGSPFGHVAIDVKNGSGDHVYLSYAMRNDLKGDLRRLGDSATIRLPLLRAHAFSEYEEWWRSGPYWHRNPKYGKAYHLLSFNCANAVSNALKFLDYNTHWTDHQFALSPKKVWQKAQSFHEHLKTTWQGALAIYDSEIDKLLLETGLEEEDAEHIHNWHELFAKATNQALQTTQLSLNEGLDLAVRQWIHANLKNLSEEALTKTQKQIAKRHTLSVTMGTSNATRWETINDAALVYEHLIHAQQRAFEKVWTFQQNSPNP